MDPQLKALIQQVRDALPVTQTIDGAVERVRTHLVAMGLAHDSSLDEKFEQVRRILAEEFEKVEILRVHHSLVAQRPRWYSGPKPADRHWPALREYLIHTKGWAEGDVVGPKSIDESSTEVVSLLANPSEEKFSCRGLVVGHVQAGKTANMTAVIAKAVDAGYDAVIILAGMTNKLRLQTQNRLVADLCERRPLEWQVLTPADEDGDFRAPPHGGFLEHTDKAQLAVVKKNVSPLGELMRTIEETPPVVRSRLRVLVIDDECDQASVNTANRELDMSRINEEIRQLLEEFPRVTYVGYTATPFANVLIQPYRVEGQQLDDLYPRDFISALPTSTSYFGAERLFGRPALDGDEDRPEEDGLDVVRIVPEEDVSGLQPPRASERFDFDPVLASSLRDACLYFIATCAARLARGNQDRHMTMLVHTSTHVAMHNKIAECIEEWIGKSARDLEAGRGADARRLTELWEEEQGRVTDGIPAYRQIASEELFGHIPVVLRRLQVPVENASSEDRIDYREPPKTYIVVGGSILARGLTLEGLVVSYFLRSSSQYDTLLQMGRWFGYRHDYEDLPRIWTTVQLYDRFRELARVEAEIRGEIAEYTKRSLTPMDVPVRIRSVPGMAITGAAKMKAASRCAISFWGMHRQTFRFLHTEPHSQVIEKNWQAGANLLEDARAFGVEPRDVRGGRLLEGVPRNAIVRFLDSYAVHEHQPDLAGGLLREFVSGAGEVLDRWNVGIIEPGDTRHSEAALGNAGLVRVVNRARFWPYPEASPSDEPADIKALMSRGDLSIDCPKKLGAGSMGWQEIKDARAKQVGDMPLLILYVIAHDSEPQQKNSKYRIRLDACRDLLGFGVVLPGTRDQQGSFYSVTLRDAAIEDVEEVEEAEEAKREQAEAAGVD